MTELSRPIVALLSSAFDAAGPSERDDITRLRVSLTVALRRCLDAPQTTWLDLVARGTDAGEWDEWRVASLVAAADPANDPEPEVTREALATLTEELIGRRDVLPGAWEGADRQAATTSPLWQEGQRRREIVFALERVVACLVERDGAGLRACAARITERDTAGRFGPVAAAIDACAADLDTGEITPNARAALRAALTDTPFAAAV